MPVRLLTFLRNAVFCPSFQAFWAKCKPRGKVLPVVRPGEPRQDNWGNVPSLPHSLINAIITSLSIASEKFGWHPFDKYGGIALITLLYGR